MVEAELRTPGVNVDIAVMRDKKILLGLLSINWLYEGRQVYGLPGRDLLWNERVGDCVVRNLREEIDCEAVRPRIVAVNANYALGQPLHWNWCGD